MMRRLFDKRLSRNEALFLLLLAALLWSLGGLLIKIVEWHPLAIAGTRSAIAALLFLAVLRRPRFDWSLPLCGGALACAATIILFVSATRLTTAANAILLQYTAPIYVALLASLLLKERTRPVDWAAIVLVLAGMGLFFMDGFTAGNQFGNLLALCSGVSFAWLVIFLRMQKNDATLEPLLLGNMLAALIGLPFITAPFPDFSGWLALVALGLFQLGLSYLLYAVAVRHVTALEASLVPVIEPLLNPVLVFLILGEMPGGWALAGGALVLLSVTGRVVLASVGPAAQQSANTETL